MFKLITGLVIVGFIIVGFMYVKAYSMVQAIELTPAQGGTVTTLTGTQQQPQGDKYYQPAANVQAGL